jgi:hypothetical protein
MIALAVQMHSTESAGAIEMSKGTFELFAALP